MDNKELKENIVNIIKAYSNLTTSFGETVRDFILNEDDFEDVAEEIVNLLPIHDVSYSFYCGGKAVFKEAEKCTIQCDDCKQVENES